MASIPRTVAPPAASPLLLSVTSRAQAAPFEVVARAAGVALRVEVCVPHSPAAVAAASGTPFNVLPVLRGEGGRCPPVARSAAVLRALAGMGGRAALAGEGLFGESACDQWLDWSLTGLGPWATALGDAEAMAGYSDKARADARGAALRRLPPLLALLDAHLAPRTFVAGERATIADVSIACAVQLVWPALQRAETDALPHVHRWLDTCVHQPFFTAGGAGGSSGSGGGGGGGGGFGGGAGASRPSLGAVPAEDGGWTAVVGTGVDTQLQSTRFRRHRQRIADVLAAGLGAVGEPATVCGWVRRIASGAAGKVFFVSLNDGSSNDVLQCVCEAGKTEGFEALGAAGGLGASLRVVGSIVKSQGKGQAIEVAAASVSVIGSVADPATYPMAAKDIKLDTLRDLQHLRPRDRRMAAMTRVRNACAYSTHRFFQERGFLYIHTPIVTGSDCEGAGEMFQVTTLMPALDAKAAGALPTAKDSGLVDYRRDFFGKPCMLTVSGQLQVEAFSVAMGDVYTFGPTFRAENSHTSRHLAEFWMIEPEIAFATLEEDMCLAEDYLKFCTQWVLDHCREDLAFFEANVEKGLVARLETVVREPFQRLTYTEAVELLRAPGAQGKFSVKVEWGDDLGSEHERYITEQVFKKPVIVTNYPKGIKAFYMKLDEDGRTVRAMDVLVPKIGELMGGSQREDDLGRLQQRMREMNVPEPPLSWYLDLRRYGSVPHAGFGLGFERLVLYLTGLENIRDAIPFPRFPGNCQL